MAYPHSKSETFADALVHLAGLMFAVPASIYLLMTAQHDPRLLVASAIYAATMTAAFLASAVYHVSPFDRTRATFGRLDHAAIYFKIAGTYTPLVTVIGTGFAYAILAIVWLIACAGAAAKLCGWATDARGSLALYLGMGWLSVLLIGPMLNALPSAAFALVAAGGLIYSCGTLVYARNHMKYQNAIWHCFVLVASVCFFAAIWSSVQHTV